MTSYESSESDYGINKVPPKRRFVDKWLNNPDFTDWLQKRITEDGEEAAFCRFCDSELKIKSGKCDLLAHKRTNKHRRSIIIPFGDDSKPSDDDEVFIPNPVETVRISPVKIPVEANRTPRRRVMKRECISSAAPSQNSWQQLEEIANSDDDVSKVVNKKRLDFTEFKRKYYIKKLLLLERQVKSHERMAAAQEKQAKALVEIAESKKRILQSDEDIFNNLS